MTEETQNQNELEALARMAESQEKDLEADFFAEEKPENASAEFEEVEPDLKHLAMAGMAVGVIETIMASLMKRKKGRGFSFTSDEKESLNEALAGVLAVSGGGLPEWLLPYRPHINLILVAGGIYVGRVMQEQALIEQQKEAENDKP